MKKYKKQKQIKTWNSQKGRLKTCTFLKNKCLAFTPSKFSFSAILQNLLQIKFWNHFQGETITWSLTSKKWHAQKMPGCGTDNVLGFSSNILIIKSIYLCKNFFSLLIHTIFTIFTNIIKLTGKNKQTLSKLNFMKD